MTDSQGCAYQRLFYIQNRSAADYAFAVVQHNGLAGGNGALQVTILSTADGKIDCLRFRFSDFFAPQKSGCSGTCRPHIWMDYGKAEWYVAPTAAEVAAIAQAAHDYVMLFA